MPHEKDDCYRNHTAKLLLTLPDAIGVPIQDLTFPQAGVWSIKKKALTYRPSHRVGPNSTCVPWRDHLRAIRGLLSVS